VAPASGFAVSARNVTDALADAMDHLRVGLVILGRDSSVLFGNGYAWEILAAADGLAVEHGVLRVTSASVGKRLQAAIEKVYRLSARTRVQCVDVFAVERSERDSPLHSCVTPLRCSTGGWVAGLFLSDPENVAPSASVFSGLYGLTPAEARLATALLRTGSVPDAARSTSISIHTARSHLKELYRKTGSRGQAELVRLLATGLGALAITDTEKSKVHPNG
jgi:DNA-binding CsgD family transcriptional regulator